VTGTLTLTVNGDEVAVAVGSTIADVVAGVLGQDEPKGVAVAVERTVVPRSAWGETLAEAGSHIEVVTAAAGG
jgi:sulfur carrier protein